MDSENSIELEDMFVSDDENENALTKLLEFPRGSATRSMSVCCVVTSLVRRAILAFNIPSMELVYTTVQVTDSVESPQECEILDVTLTKDQVEGHKDEIVRHDRILYPIESYHFSNNRRATNSPIAE